jgi:biofilm PGA synthesis N-glycosyltransferase PgaC
LLKESRVSYVLATPVRNERSIVVELVRSIERLEPRPAAWVVVDDGSTDGSREWLDEQAATRPWMVVQPAPEPADEYLGGHVARIKRWGLSEAIALATARGEPPSFAGIIDADIVVAPDHYARLIAAMHDDPQLGVVSSIIASRNDRGEVHTDPFQRSDEPRGGTQFFRVACLDDIGGLPPWPGFDGAANVKARGRGWRTRLVTDVVAVQQREMASRFGVAAGYDRRGRYAWFLGVHPVLIAGRAAAYSASVGPSAGLRFLGGYFGDALRRKPRCPDPDVRREYGWRRVREVALSILGRGHAYVGRDRP